MTDTTVSVWDTTGVTETAAVSCAPLSARQAELLELAYQYVLERGLADLSLRPLAAAVRSSPRVLLYLFGSKDGLVRALLARARADELAFIGRVRRPSDVASDLHDVAGEVWTWLAAEEHRPLLVLWLQGYSQSLVHPDGPWAGFARATVEDWLGLLAESQPRSTRHTPAAVAQRTAILAVLRGALLDLLASGDVRRTTAAVRSQLRGLR
jgi:AcrR family transcriptional regulator